MIIAPSILAADPLHMARDTARMTEAGCDWLHVDIMDGHFVPNLSYGPALVKALKGAFDTVLDVHLMISEPEKYIDTFVKNGADIVTVHAEISGGAENVLKKLRALRVKAGLALKPATPAAAVRALFPLCGMILVMTVEPGFGGQSFMPDAARKIADLRALGYTGLIEADGGISRERLADLAALGLDAAVMGTAMFRAADPAADIAYAHAIASRQA